MEGGIVAAESSKPPPGFEIALLTHDAQALYSRAIKAGATKVSEPETKS
jgi:hypothetical protein